MKPIKTTQYPTNFLFFDTETKDNPREDDKEAEYHYLWFGHAIAFRREGDAKTRCSSKTFHTVEEFWEYLFTRLDRNRPLYVFAHNLGFDLTIVDFWEKCDEIPITVELPVIDDPPTFFITKINGCKCIFVDTYNYWREPLANIGESLGIPKGTMPEKNDEWIKWESYCKRDVEILCKAVYSLIDFLLIHDLGRFAYSTPAIAMGTYKHRFMPEKTIAVHDNAKVLVMERDSYHGGLVHCFYIGKIKGTVYKLDINSLYPAMMLEPQPVKLQGHWPNVPLTKLERLCKDNICMADVTISSKERTYPYYDGTRLIEAKGTYRCCLCGPELSNAVRCGDVQAAHHVAVYGSAVIFSEYVRYFYTLRSQFKQDHNSIGDKFAKMMLNSLYGKFGQRSSEWIELTAESLYGIYAVHKLPLPGVYENAKGLPRIAHGAVRWQPIGLPHTVTIRRFGGRLEIKCDRGEHWESSPIIAANITALARTRLRYLIGKAGRGNVFYCDTDSLFVNKPGFRNLERLGELSSNEMGKLKLEDTSTNTEIKCPKDYTFNGNVVIKGVRKNAISIGQNIYKQQSFEGIKSVLRRNGERYIRIGWIEKQLSRTYSKGIVRPNGWVDYITLGDGE